MNSASLICASSASSGSQKPSMLASSDRLGVAAELLPGQLLHQFLQRADAAGQGDEGVGTLEHQPLALVHVGRDDHLLNALQGVLAGGQKVRDDAGDGAAMIEHGGRHRAHQPDRTAAIDEADVVLGEGLAQCDGGFDEAGIGAGAGAAIDTDSFDFAHAAHVALQRKSVKQRIAQAAGLPANPGNRERICFRRGARGA